MCKIKNICFCLIFISIFFGLCEAENAQLLKNHFYKNILVTIEGAKVIGPRNKTIIMVDISNFRPKAVKNIAIEVIFPSKALEYLKSKSQYYTTTHLNGKIICKIENINVHSMKRIRLEFYEKKENAYVSIQVKEQSIPNTSSSYKINISNIKVNLTDIKINQLEKLNMTLSKKKNTSDKSIHCHINGPRTIFSRKHVTFKITLQNKKKNPIMTTVTGIYLSKHWKYIDSKPKGIFISETKKQLPKIIWKTFHIKASHKKKIELILAPRKPGSSNIYIQLESKQYQSRHSIHTVVTSLALPYISSYETEDPCKVGDKTTYVVRIRNEGTSPITNNIVKCKLPKELQYVSVQNQKQWVYSSKYHTIVFLPQKILQPGEKKDYKVRCKANYPGKVNIIFSWSYDQWKKKILDTEITTIKDVFDRKKNNK